MSEELLVCLIGGLLGIGCIAAYLRGVARVVSLWRRGIRTYGVVVDHQVSNTDAGISWTPIIAFDDQHGNRVTCMPCLQMDERYPLGHEVPVVHSARKPQLMLVNTTWDMVRPLLQNMILLVAGAGFLAGAVAFFIVG
ncbi:DUF3592 domain-containing protein [Actinomadura keratinilytica]|jgi:hypothetical protein|uniref:DUF3592 domain-containing protein n=1 Tax=Actinomadura keratinilytica TaxID=547461 RepID=A0ABP7ZEJ8_9ACTN